MKKRILIILFQLFVSVTAHGQVTETIVESVNPDIRSPQLADMIRFDNTPVALNAGRIDLSIPLIEFVDPDFDLPVSICYNSGGFMPSKSESSVGLNWSLIVGGAVYREVKGVPDDHQAAYAPHLPRNQAAKQVAGFLAYAHGGAHNFTGEDIYDNPGYYAPYIVNHADTYGLPVLRGTNIEASSDIYNFSFGDYSGKFVINYSGGADVVINSGGSVRVDISEYRHIPADPYSPRGKRIKIVTDEGYTYVFGGSRDALEYAAHSWTAGREMPPDKPKSIPPPPLMKTIHAFYLKEIISPNGRVLQLDYLNKTTERFHHEDLAYVMGHARELIGMDAHLEFVLSAEPRYYGDGESIDENLLMKMFSLNRVAVIRSIRTDDKYVLFNYSAPSRTIFDPAQAGDFAAACGAQLNSVELYHKDIHGELRDRAELAYEYLGAGTQRLFLTKVTRSGTGSYTFSYNTDYFLPDPFTTNIDHWRYWRGTPYNKRFIPLTELKPSPGNEVTYLTDDREPKGNQCDLTLLRRVVYPTGGSTVFMYEPNFYSDRLERKDFSYRPELTSMGGNMTGGGARVRKTVHYDSDGSVLKETGYEYTFPFNDKSSGILTFWPQYKINKRDCSGQNAITIHYYEPYGHNAPPSGSDVILYSYVRETMITEESADSLFSMSINPLDNIDYRKYKDILIGGERVTCRITGRGYNGATSRVSIDDVAVCVFSSDETREFNIDLSATLSPGTHRMIMEARENAFVRADITVHRGGVRGPYTITRFTDHRDNPDDWEYCKVYESQSTDGPSVEQFCPGDYYLFRNFNRAPQDRSSERGKVYRQSSYTSDGKLVRSVTNNYSRTGTGGAKYAVVFENMGRFRHSQMGRFTQMNSVYMSPVLLKSTITEEYRGAPEAAAYEPEEYVITEEFYDYDGLNYLRQTATVDSAKDTLRSVLYYLHDAPGFENSPMNSLNYTAPVTRREVYHNESPVSTLVHNYDLKNNSGGGSVLVRTSSELSKADNAPQTRIEYIEHDGYGNPMSVVFNGLPTVYIWGYEGKYPIAQIVNATYSQVCEALGMTDAGEISRMEVPGDSIFGLLDSLRQELPGAQVYTYSYKPLVGMTRETDPSGTTTHYDYDHTGRLSEVYKFVGGVRQVLRSYRYHYANQ